jgi:hypothetical protein
MEKIQKNLKEIPVSKMMTYKELLGDGVNLGTIDNRKTDFVITGDTDSMFCCFENRTTFDASIANNMPIYWHNLFEHCII